MALFSNDKIMSIILLMAIIFITLLLESYSFSAKQELFEIMKTTIVDKKTQLS